MLTFRCTHVIAGIALLILIVLVMDAWAGRKLREGIMSAAAVMAGLENAASYLHSGVSTSGASPATASPATASPSTASPATASPATASTSGAGAGAASGTNGTSTRDPVSQYVQQLANAYTEAGGPTSELATMPVTMELLGHSMGKGTVLAGGAEALKSNSASTCLNIVPSVVKLGPTTPSSNTN